MTRNYAKSECPCPRTRRAWRDDGTCATCQQRVSEGQLQDAIRIALDEIPGLRLWRNNCGVATIGPRRVVYGLEVGSADLVGLYCGRFVAVEVKAPDGRQSVDQRKWQRVVEQHGGIYLIVRNPDTAVSDVMRAIRGAAP